MTRKRTAAACSITVLAALAVALVAGGPVAAAPAARVTVSPATLRPDRATTLSLHGSGFQSIKGGFGGIYVLFGTVDGHWRPSQGGITGVDYRYVPDSQTKDNHGYEKFVSFLDGGTLAEANGGVIAADGTWATTLVVPGATFTTTGAGGTTVTVDCRKVPCGVITIGAHGVVDPDNETFTPVTFATPKTAAPTTRPPGRSSGHASTATPSPTSAPGPLTIPTPATVPATAAPTSVAMTDAAAVSATTALTVDARWIAVLATVVVLVAGAGAFRHRRATRTAKETRP